MKDQFCAPPSGHVTFLTSAIEDGRRLLFSPLSVCLWTVLRKNSSTDFDETWWGIRYSPRIMPLDFGLGPKKKNFFSKKFRFYSKNIWIFFYFAFLHVLSDFQPKKKKLLEKTKLKILQLKKKKISILFEKYLNFFFLHFYMF